MNIDLIAKSTSHKSNFIYTDFFMNQDFNLILMTHNLEQSPFLDKVNSVIINELLDKKFDEIPLASLQSEIKEFFIALNWQLYSLFNKNESAERGISVMLCITTTDTAYVVQFGRFLCGLLHHDFEIIGEKWEHFSVKSANELNLLGSKDKNIPVKIHKISLQKNSYLLAIPSDIAENLIQFKEKPKKLLGQIQLISQKEDFPFFVLKTRPSLTISKKPFLKNFRTRLIAVILLLIIITSTLYVFYGKNWLAEQQYLLQTRNEEFIRNELLEKMVETQETLNQTLQEMYDFELFPNQELEYTEAMTYKFNHTITTKPFFDLRSIYYGSENTLHCVKKNNVELRWQKHFKSSIHQLILVDANRILVILSDKMKCLNRETGLLLWEKQFKFQEIVQKPSPYQISLNRFKQLDNSIIFIPQSHGFTLINNLSSEIILQYESDQEINFVSDFDQMEKALYIVQDNTLRQIKIGLK